MPVLIAPKSTSSHPPAPAGSHYARCVSMIDLGTHETTGQFGTKRERKLRLSFELPNEKAVFNEDKGEQPYMVHHNFTFSMHKKSKLRGFLEGWRAKPFSDEEASQFDMSKLVGASAMLTVMHVTKATGTYANIGAAAKMPRGMDCPAQVTRSVIFSLADFEQETFDELPDWMKEEISSSYEYAAMVKSENERNKRTDQVEESDDDIPF